MVEGACGDTKGTTQGNFYSLTCRAKLTTAHITSTNSTLTVLIFVFVNNSGVSIFFCNYAPFICLVKCFVPFLNRLFSFVVVVEL